ncbi:nuclease-related domain-containing protein [Streptomyces marincola]|uniref:nuclease-related domain-containing protein n=1 Tax=Streptomyces marincola TaxID=2878388 RepID=UPI001CF39828|nr:nuclease-related domain-containing protein [Streptomyces marincola]UCM89989.1 NERD domain-containing protein [Streptomyces marincola]
MLTEVLSDHPGRQLRRTEGAIERHHRDIAEHAAAVAGLRARHAAARRWWQLLKRLRQYFEVRALEARAPVVDPALLHRRAQQEAGVLAEDAVTHALGELPDEWLLFRGYTNRKGEIDHLVVGPGGVWAIEVKGRNVCVHVQGDHWSYEKYDQYGNLVEQGALTDRRGRSWGRQVGEPAFALQTFLATRGVHTAVRTAVAVINDRASLGVLDDCPIDVVSIGTHGLLDSIRARGRVLDAGTCRRIAALIRRDHAFHQQRRGPRRR